MKLKAAVRLRATECYAEQILGDVDLPLSSLEDINEIIKSNLKPGVDIARKSVDHAVTVTAAKLKAWAVAHLRQAKQLGRRTDLFEKLINDPHAAALQLAHSMLGITPKPEKEDMRAIDDVLENLEL